MILIQQTIAMNIAQLNHLTDFQFYTQEVICYINQKKTCASVKLLNSSLCLLN